MPKKKVTDEEIVAAVEDAAAETKTSKTKKVAPKKVAVKTTKKAEVVEEAPAEVVEEIQEVEAVVEEVKAPKVVETIVEDDVTVEKTADGVIEVKKHEDNQSHAEEITIEQKLLSLYNLQQICTQIDNIRMVRGELPEEIRDKEDECEGKRTRIAKFRDEISNLNSKIASEGTKKEEALAAIKKYEEQQNNVRNNREYESLSKEIEYQNLEIQVADKHKAKYETEIGEKEVLIQETEEKLKELEEILVQKKEELKKN